MSLSVSGEYLLTSGKSCYINYITVSKSLKYANMLPTEFIVGALENKCWIWLYFISAQVWCEWIKTY